MVYDRVRVLRDGSEVTLQTRPVDPRDFLRGDYVVLNYEIIERAGRRAARTRRRRAAARRCSSSLRAKPDGIYGAVSVHPEPVPVADGEVLIRGRAAGGATCGAEPTRLLRPARITYGIERYFVPEGEGKEIESARNKGKVSIVAAVTPAGRAAIKRLLLDGKPVYDEPMF